MCWEGRRLECGKAVPWDGGGRAVLRVLEHGGSRYDGRSLVTCAGTCAKLNRAQCSMHRYMYSLRNRMYESLAPYIKESDKSALAATLQVCS